MSLTRIPLPSFALVLTSDVVFLPTRPSALKCDFDPLQTVYPAASAEHASNHSNDIEIQHSDPVPTADEESLFNFLNDSATDIGKLEADDGSNTVTQTIFTEKRPASSRGSRLNNVKLDFLTLVTAIRKLLRAIPKGRTSRVDGRVNTQK